MVIYLGVPHIAVDAVQDAVQHVLTPLDDLVQPPPTLLGGDLPGIALADSEQAVTGDDAALEEVDGTAFVLGVVLVRPLWEGPLKGGHPLVREAKVVEHLALLHALVAEVVDGQRAAGFGVHPVGPELAGQVHRHHGGVPIVGHKHHLLAHRLPMMRWKGHHQRGLTAREREQCEAHLVVLVRAALVRVDAGALKAMVGHKDVVYALIVLVEVRHLLLLAKAPETLPDPSVLGTLIPGIHWDHHHHVVATLYQGLWNRTHYIAKAAGFRVWGALRGAEDNVHGCGGKALLP
mmetsp:Transcript_32049/g.90910  ORF Transcript_32049/g.90910 Transcript_32049/m.90910 type:complete len:291 (+) Transcript_32049:956-1828(+)